MHPLLFYRKPTDGRRRFLSDPGLDAAVDTAAAPQQLYVQVVPILAAAFCKPLSASMTYLAALHGSIQWRQREFQDVGVLAVRCVVAHKRFGVRAASLQQLIRCRAWNTPGVADLLCSSPDPRQQLLLLPEHDLPIMRVNTQLDQASFDNLVYQHLQAPSKQPWAFVGPGNFKADGWLVLQLEEVQATAAVSLEQAAAAPRKPFVIYVSSKQRIKPRKITASRIMREKAKDVISDTFAHAYLYVTDQQLESSSSSDDGVLAANSLVVVAQQHHDAFYGCVARLLELVKL